MAFSSFSKDLMQLNDEAMEMVNGSYKTLSSL